MKKYDGIIFDFNGTLLDDCDVCLKILNELTFENNLPKVSKEEYLEVFTFPVSNYYEQLGFDINYESFLKIGNKFHEKYDKYSYTEAKIFDSAFYLLDYLKNNNYEIICLSASKQDTLEKQLKYYKIANYFDSIIGLSDKYARSKKDVALDFINKNQNKKYLFIGDSIHDLEVSNAIGVDCLLISTGHTAKHRLVETNNKVIDDLKEVLYYI